VAWFVYLARCADDTLYCGIAIDVAERIAAHDAGRGARYTRGRGPLTVVATRRCPDRGSAQRLEYAVKQLSRTVKAELAAKPARWRAIARRVLAGDAATRYRGGVGKIKTAGRTARARSSAKAAPAAKRAPAAKDNASSGRAVTLPGNGVATVTKPRARQITGSTQVAVPLLKPRSTTATSERPALGVLPGMRALSKTTTMMSAPVPMPRPAAPPAPRDELPAPRDVARLLRYGERFGEHRIDSRMLGVQLPATVGTLAVFDPAVPKSWRAFDRPIGAGQFRVMLSVAKKGEAEQLAAIVIHVGRPPIARWTVAHYRGSKKPKSAEALPRVPITSGWLALVDGGDPSAPIAPPVAGAAAGLNPVELALVDGRRALAFPCTPGEHAAYWGIDAADKPVCLVIELDIFKLKEWKLAKPG
jgi:putative endonuclease